MGILRASSSKGDISVMTISVSKDGELMHPEIVAPLAAARDQIAASLEAARIGTYQEVAAALFGGSKGTVSNSTR